MIVIGLVGRQLGRRTPALAPASSSRTISQRFVAHRTLAMPGRVPPVSNSPAKGRTSSEVSSKPEPLCFATDKARVRACFESDSTSLALVTTKSLGWLFPFRLCEVSTNTQPAE